MTQGVLVIMHGRSRTTIDVLTRRGVLTRGGLLSTLQSQSFSSGHRRTEDTLFVGQTPYFELERRDPFATADISTLPA